MKTYPFILAGIMGVWLSGCATPARVVTTPVGPNPTQRSASTPDGRLEVYSALQWRNEGSEFTMNPGWYQHTDYVILDQNGKRLRHVGNSIGEYSETPADISLPPGEYTVRARAQDYLMVDVPVIVKPGLITRVHLDDKWHAPAGTPAANLVKEPNGEAIGWRATLSGQGRAGAS